MRHFVAKARNSLILAGIALAASAGGQAFAAASSWWEHDQGAVRLIAASDATGAAESLAVGLHFRMKPGWKIYWRSPGDAGFPPRPNWAGSENLADAAVSWPAPTRFEVVGLQTLGYKDEVVLPVAVSTFEPGKPVNVRAKVPFLTCDDICVPYTAVLSLDLPAGAETTSREAGLLQKFQSRVPRAPGATLDVDKAEVASSGDRHALLISVRAAEPLAKPDVYIEGPEALAFGAPEVRLSDGGRQALLRVAVSAAKGRGPDLDGTPVTLTVVDGARAVEKKVSLTAAASVPVAAGRETVGASLLVILGLAFLGGLILNLMPCVLPVLSIKLLSVVGHGGADRHAVRAGFLASAAGILVSFLVLATAAVGLSSAGHAVGWGIQFQEPLFLVVMIIILSLFASNLWGLFEIRLPGAIADAAGHAGGGHSMGGHFLVGAFATLLATPCTAPFLGTAVSFALSRGPFEIYAVFAALGIGLGAPYLAVAAMPGLATRLPKPGPWMVTLRRILSIALAGTALWLLTVAAVQTGLAIAAMVALLMVTMAVALWQLRHLPSDARGATWGVVGALCVLALIATVSLKDTAPPVTTVADKVWRPFDRGAIAAEVRRGRVVLVDVTADWCLTCKVNKALVLDRNPVLDRLVSKGVTPMRADWTRPDPAISDYLKSFGRYGIPFNVVYGPGTPQGEPLSELLTTDAVMAALNRAAGGTAKVSAR